MTDVATDAGTFARSSINFFIKVVCKEKSVLKEKKNFFSFFFGKEKIQFFCDCVCESILIVI